MRLGVLIAAMPLLLMGCSASGGVLDSTESVCDEFAAHAKEGLPADGRAEVVESIGMVIGNADPKVRDAYGGLQRTVDNDSAYQLAADTFAQACFDAGWDG